MRSLARNVLLSCSHASARSEGKVEPVEPLLQLRLELGIIWILKRACGTIKERKEIDLLVLLLNTEGLDAPHVDQFYNWSLSALTLLISDLYMYQTKALSMPAL